jgi:DNA-binding NtrC family response regulator
LERTIARKGRLEIRGGTLRIEGGDRPVVIGSEPVTVGRDSSCQLVVDDGLVSSVHADFVATSEGVRLRDLGSSNGTFLSGARVTEAYLLERCRVTIGETRLDFEPSRPERMAVTPSTGVGKLVGGAASMLRVFDLIRRAAPTDLTVLLLGETGTGKELAARAIHDASHRAKGPFVVVDCGAISPSLAEAHLFGHERGAFTGAVERRESPFVQASGGTLFLDELGELPIELQPKLLRVLAERRVKSVGGSKYRDVDVRIVAATRRDLVRAVNEGAFRSDLYFRVAELRIEIPPLRDRLEDVPLLVRHMLASLGDPDGYKRVGTNTLERLMRRDWPGNVRELRNAVTVAHALSNGDDIDIAAHTGDARASQEGEALAHGTSYHDAKRAVLDRFEREYFSALQMTAGGRINEIAKLAGLERAHVRKYLRRHGLGATRTRAKSRS